MAKAVGCSVAGCDKAALPGRRGFCGSHYKRLLRYGDPLGGGTGRGLPIAFIKAAVSSETEDCILWPYGRTSGYGNIRRNGESVLAHRLVCLEVHGDPPDPSLEAAHFCGVRRCVNPRHLRWATSAENNADKKIHGTNLEGIKAPSARFKAAEVIDMRSRRARGESLGSIGRSFGVGATHIRRIVNGETYRNVQQQEA